MLLSILLASTLGAVSRGVTRIVLRGKYRRMQRARGVGRIAMSPPYMLGRDIASPRRKICSLLLWKWREFHGSFVSTHWIFTHLTGRALFTLVSFSGHAPHCRVRTSIGAAENFKMARKWPEEIQRKFYKFSFVPLYQHKFPLINNDALSISSNVPFNNIVTARCCIRLFRYVPLKYAFAQKEA